MINVTILSILSQCFEILYVCCFWCGIHGVFCRWIVQLTVAPKSYILNSAHFVWTCEKFVTSFKVSAVSTEPNCRKQEGKCDVICEMCYWRPQPLVFLVCEIRRLMSLVCMSMVFIVLRSKLLQNTGKTTWKVQASPNVLIWVSCAWGGPVTSQKGAAVSKLQIHSKMKNLTIKYSYTVYYVVAFWPWY